MNFFFIFILFFYLVLGNIDSAPYELSLIFSIYQQEAKLEWLSECRMFTSVQYEALANLDNDLLKLKYIIQLTQTLNLEGPLESLQGTDIDSLINFFKDNGGENKIKAGFIASTIFTKIEGLGNSNSNYATKLNFLLHEVFNMRGNFLSGDLPFLNNAFSYLNEINSIRNRDFLESVTDEGKSGLNKIGVSIVNDALYLTDPATSSLENTVNQAKTLSKADFGGLTPKTHLENILHLNRLSYLAKNFGC